MNQVRVVAFNPISWNGEVCHPTSSMSRYNFDNVTKNYSKNFHGIFELIIDVGNGNTNVEYETNIGITSGFITACECLGASLYPASLLFASVSVERVLNHDMRMNDHLELSTLKWLSLSRKILNCAKKRGLPTDLLLGTDESLEDENGDIKFVTWRHKVAHGDTEGFRISKLPKKIELGVQYENTWEPSIEDALIQINKARNFLAKWGEQNPVLRLH